MDALSKKAAPSFLDFILFSFIGADSYTRPNTSGYYFDRMSKFTQAQREAIELFLWFISQQKLEEDLDAMRSIETLDDVWFFTKPT